MQRIILIVIALLALLANTAWAETPDECAARLDREIAIRSYTAAAEWWEQVQRDCKVDPQPETASTPEPTEIPGYMGHYGWEGDFVFCVMSNGLNIRNSPAGSVIDQLDKGNHFTIDLASQTLLDGYVWGKHDKGWSAIFRFPLDRAIHDFTHPRACPKPTPQATPTSVRTTRTHTSTTCPDRNLIIAARRIEDTVQRAEAICLTKHIMIEFKLGDTLFGSPVDVAKLDMHRLLCKLRINDYGITFDIHADFIDSAGNESKSRAILARFEGDAVRRINCDYPALSIQWERLASSWWVHPGVP